MLTVSHKLELWHDHMFFFRPVKLTAGRPSGGLAIAVNKKSSCSLSESSDVYISVDFGSFVLMCVYMPTNYRSESSYRKFATACASLSKSIHRVRSAYKSKFSCSNFNTDLKNENAPLTQILLSSLPSGVFLLPKSKPFSYMHDSGFTSDLDFVLTDIQQMQGTMVDVSSVSILTSDHLSLQFRLTYSLPLHVKSLSVFFFVFFKPCWNRLDLPLYQRTLYSILSKIRILFQFLFTSINGNARDLYCYLAELVHSIKVASSVSLPLTKIRVGTCKKGWTEDGRL